MSRFLSINDLPLEIFVEILTLIDGVTLGKCRRVCKKWKECIDSIDTIWYKMCRKEYKLSSKIAKKKAGHECSWYHIYRNLKMWSDLTPYEKNLREFFKFSLRDKCHILDVDNSVLPLRDARGTILYDTSTLKYIPVALPERNCFKIANNDLVTVIQLKWSIIVQRTVDSPNFVSETSYKADDFVLTPDCIYFVNNRDVFKCDVQSASMLPKLLLHCDYDIKKIQHSEGSLYIYTDNGKIVTVNKDGTAKVQLIRVPLEWVKQLKHIFPVDDKNFVSYSRDLFKIETDKFQHMYIDFPPITALFFYVDVVLLGTRAGEILLYRLSSQKRAHPPVFETLARLPDGKFPVQLDVCERKTGTIIIASTLFELFLLEIKFVDEQESKITFSSYRLAMYKRLLKLKDRLKQTSSE